MNKKETLKNINQQLNILLNYFNTHLVPTKNVSEHRLFLIDKKTGIILTKDFTCKIDHIISMILPFVNKTCRQIFKDKIKDNLKDYIFYLLKNCLRYPDNKQQYIEKFIYDWTSNKLHRTTFYFKIGNILPPRKKLVINNHIFINKASRIRELSKRHIVHSRYQLTGTQRQAIIFPNDTILRIELTMGFFPYNVEEANQEAQYIIDIINFFFCYEKPKVYLLNIEDYNVPTREPTSIISVDSASILGSGLDWIEVNTNNLLKASDLDYLGYYYNMFDELRKKKEEIYVKYITSFKLICTALQDKNMSRSVLQIIVALDVLLSQDRNSILDRKVNLNRRLLTKNTLNSKLGWKKTQISEIVAYLISTDRYDYLLNYNLFMGFGKLRDGIVHDGEKHIDEKDYDLLIKKSTLFMGNLLILLLLDSNINQTCDLWDYCHEYLFKAFDKVKRGVIADNVIIEDEELQKNNPLIRAKFR